MSRVTTAFTNSMPFGDAYAITCAVGATASTAGLQRYRFVVADTATNTGNLRPVKYPAANANAKLVLGLIGGYRVQAPSTNAGSYSVGSATDPYAVGEYVAVTVRGSDLVEAAVAAGEEGAIAFGDFIVTDAAGKAVKWTTQTVTPSMTATLAETAIGETVTGATATIGDTDVGGIITSATATLSSDPNATEVKAWAEEVIAETIAAESVKLKALLTEILPVYAGLNSTAIKAYLTEYVADYGNAGNAGYEAVIGVALGGPDADGLVPFIFCGRA